MVSIDKVPVYKLYGEHELWLTPDMVHCESIADRSKLHDWKIKLHRHHGLLQLLYLKEGSARVHLDGRRVDMRSGQIVVVPQMCIHGFKFSTNANGHVVTLAYPLFHKLTQGMVDISLASGGSHVYRVSDEHARIDMAFDLLAAEYKSDGLHRNALMEAMLASILIWLSRNGLGASNSSSAELDCGQRHFKRFCQLIEQGYTTQLSVNGCAKKIGITAAYLNVLCRQMVNQSALELIHQRVVLAAKRNLVYTSMRISTVSYTLGFSDPAYFSRFFKRHVGVSPKQFRQHAATLVE